MQRIYALDAMNTGHAAFIPPYLVPPNAPPTYMRAHLIAIHLRFEKLGRTRPPVFGHLQRPHFQPDPLRGDAGTQVWSRVYLQREWAETLLASAPVYRVNLWRAMRSSSWSPGLRVATPWRSRPSSLRSLIQRTASPARCCAIRLSQRTRFRRPPCVPGESSVACGRVAHSDRGSSGLLQTSVVIRCVRVGGK